MRSTIPAMSSLVVVALLAGCARVPNQFREDGPAATVEWDTPTARDIKARFAPAEPRHREWAAAAVAAESGAIQHEPLYFEDPFEDRGHGRTDASHPLNVHRLGWEDYVALPYGVARFTANWLLLPLSAVVTPPWTEMESDGRLSKQLFFEDHDAARVSARGPRPAPEAAP